MIASLKKLLPKIESWPLEDQEALAAAAREIEAERAGIYKVSDDERLAIEEALSEAERGLFASEAEIAAIFSRARGR